MRSPQSTEAPVACCCIREKDTHGEERVPHLTIVAPVLQFRIEATLRHTIMARKGPTVETKTLRSLLLHQYQGLVIETIPLSHKLRKIRGDVPVAQQTTKYVSLFSGPIKHAPEVHTTAVS